MVGHRSAIAFLLLLTTLVAVGIGGADRADATHGRVCGIVSKGAKDFRVLGKRMPCRRAMKGARVYLRKHRPLRRFSCIDRAGAYAFICGNGAKTYRAQRL